MGSSCQGLVSLSWVRTIRSAKEVEVEAEEEEAEEEEEEEKTKQNDLEGDDFLTGVLHTAARSSANAC